MTTLTQESSVTAKTIELCEAIVADEQFGKLQAQVEAFLTNDEAKLQYQSVHDMGDALNQKQSSGVELGDAEISAFEQAREQLLQNSIVTDFMGAQQELTAIQKTVGKYVGLTIEAGKVPTEEEIAAASQGGCCGGGGGGGGGGGCGC